GHRVIRHWIVWLDSGHRVTRHQVIWLDSWHRVIRHDSGHRLGRDIRLNCGCRGTRLNHGRRVFRRQADRFGYWQDEELEDGTEEGAVATEDFFTGLKKG
ncbi:unnamed protein product, partial [Staurois parvus]